ncbi:DUF6544 family protein [Sulfitobacter sp. JB4-11]|uniref:DUF6544 family protein n=1 Tax=Sulfitobacter rhodophyticola TaxID=3238304 RepID=UPI003D819873
MKILLLSLGIVAAALLVLVVLRLLDARADRILARSLIADTTATPPRFEPAMLDGLPDPAARFFRFVMEDGAPLHTVARITMQGQLNLGLAEKATFQAMQARQTLAPPHGFVWQVRLGGLSKVTGTDAYRPDTSWSRFRLLDLIPVGRVSDNPDHLRSAFGRMVGEGLFWTPAAFLPATRAGWDQIAWHPVDAQTAAVVVRHNGLEQRAEVTVDAGGLAPARGL